MDNKIAVLEQVVTVPESDLELLADALQAAVDARQTGKILGPAVDEVALRRARRRASRADARRVLIAFGGAA